MSELSKSLGLSKAFIEKTDTIPQFMAEGHAAEIGLKPADVDQEELWMGTEIEQEHTKDRRVAAKIALDHFAEFPKGGYYYALGVMEKFLKSIAKMSPDKRKRMIGDFGKLAEKLVLDHQGEQKREEADTDTSTDTSSDVSSDSARKPANTRWYSRK